MPVLTQQKEMVRLCVGCGICLGLCTTHAIKLKATKGVLTVNFDYSRCTNCGMCIKACPAIFNLYREDSKIADVLGKIDKIFFGYSTDHNVRYHGASGGVVTALTCYMLRRRLVDKVLVVKMTKFTTDALLTGSEHDVMSAQGSIYFKTFSLRLLPELLYDARKGKRICIVGLPCQISALKRVMRGFESKLYFIGLVCNHVNEIWYLEYVVKKYLPRNARPISIGSRKNGWPGRIKMVFSLNKGLEELSIPSGEFFLLDVSSPLGCILCADHLAATADIVAGDAWHPKFIGKNSSGVSIIMIRTIKGLELVQDAIRDRVLYAGETGLRDLLVTQGDHVVEGTRYAPLRKKLLKRNIIVLLELRNLDELMVALLYIVKDLVSRFKILRRFLGTCLAEKSLLVIVIFLNKQKRRLSLLLLKHNSVSVTSRR